PKRARYQAAPRPDRDCPQIRLSLGFQQGQDGGEFFAQIEQQSALCTRRGGGWGRTAESHARWRSPGRDCRRRRRGDRFGFRAAGPVRVRGGISEMLARARDGEALVVKQPLDLENRLDILAAVKTMAARAFHWLQRGKFRLPVTQHKRLGRSNA